MFFVAIAMLMISCEKDNDAIATGNGVTNPKELRLTARQTEMLQVSNDFTFNLLRKVKQENEHGNVVLSPLSASMMLGMVMNGADGATLSQLKTSLGFNDEYSIEEINGYYHELIDALPALDKTNTMKLAYSIWAQINFPFYKTFIDTNKQWFSAKVDNEDFSDSRIADIINQWAAQNTNNLITKVVTPQELEDAKMVLANALYFKGIWKEKFSKNTTRHEDFNTADGTTIKVSMMSLKKSFKHAYIDDGQLLEMDYKEGKYCMDILLPDKEKNLDNVIAALTAEKWNTWLSKIYSQEVNVRFPKLETKYDAELNVPLIGTGIVDAFSPLKADFSKMSEIGLYLSIVKQSCYLKVDEEGTEAAAVTIGIMEPTADLPTHEPVNFIVDRPYLMVIREKQYGTILFTAAIGNPDTAQ